MRVGDFVGRKSYNCDIVFVINKIINDTVILQGYYIRLVADSPLSDLVLIDEEELSRHEQNNIKAREKIISSYKGKISHIAGKILHIDSDPVYLKRCLSLYKSLGLYSYGLMSREDEMSNVVLEYIKKVRPNVVILTGHDSYNNKGIHNLNNYKNTKAFIKAISKIRERYSMDDICIFAGACGSNFEALIASGANFASSVDRKNIDAYDPAIVGILAAITPITEIIDIGQMYNYSKLDYKTVGGVETYGKMRLLMR
ncbi:MAG: sporulation peptidase YabG [Acholeplasmatales bacterium]|nr:sporulation peptidase YabG [Acholeplasmatales bacterium]